MMIAPYRIPFDLDPQWDKVGKANWDDPTPNPDDRHGEYEFDFGFPEGHVIRAARSGIVVAAASGRVRGDGTPGNFVFIRHPDGTATTYAHLLTDSVKVRMNDWVAQGQAIAKSGNTGDSGAPHLHFQVMAFANAEGDVGPSLPVLFHDNAHRAWRPLFGESLKPNNTLHRQENWRFCSKCTSMFFAGVTETNQPVGVCAEGGGHDGSGSDNYVLVLDAPASVGQKNWNWCRKCSALFFGGNPGSRCPAGGGHDNSVSGNYNATPETAPDVQKAWRWCRKCQGMFFFPAQGSRCAAGGPHDAAGSGMYGFLRQIPTIAQGDWRWCGKCEGLYFRQGTRSVCPAGGAHTSMNTSYYALMYDLSPTVTPAQLRLGGQSNWRHCNKCQGLFFGGNPGSRCPAGGAHDGQGSGNYRLMDADVGPGESGWRWCHQCQGMFYAMHGTSKCPAGGQHATAGSGNYRLWVRF